MILTALKAAHFGMFRSTVSVSGFSEGVNLLDLPNETGKSTLFIALHHAFFTPYSSTAQEIKSLVPWDTDLSPSVEVEFETSEGRYRLKKSFVRNSACLLEEWTGSRFEPKLDSDRADEFVRGVLMGEKPGRGAAKPEHRGMARLLWCPQGKEALDTPVPGRAVVSVVRPLLGSMSIDPVESRVLEKILADHSKVFDSRGNARKNTDLKHLTEQVTRTEGEKRDVREALKNTERYSEELGEDEEQLRRLEEEREEHESSMNELSKKADEVKALKQKVETAQAELETKKQLFVRIDQDSDIHRTKCKQCKKLDENLAKCKGELQQLEAVGEEAEKRLEGLSAERKELAGRHHKALKLQRELNLKKELWSSAKQRDSTNDLLKSVEKIESEIAGLKKERDKVPGVSAADLKKAGRLVIKIRDLETRVKASGVRVKAEMDPEREIRCEGSEGADTRIASNSDPAEFFTLDRMKLEIIGVGALNIESGAGDAKKLHEEKTAKKADLQKVLDKYGAADSGSMVEMAAERKEKEQQLLSVGKLKKELLGSAGDTTALREESASIERRIKALAHELGIDPATADSLMEPDAGNEDEEVERLSLEVDENAEMIEKHRGEIDENRKKQGVLSARVTGMEAELKAAEQTKAEILQRYGEEKELRAQYEGARRERDAAKAKEKELLGLLPRGDDDPDSGLSRKKAACDAVVADIRQFEKKIAGTRRLLEDQGAKGLYSRLAALEERLELERNSLRRERTRARAVGLLNSLMHIRKERLNRSIVRPLEHETSRLWRRVTSDDSRETAFGEGLALTGFRSHGEGRELSTLSAGAREQLYLAVRLALARHLAEREKQLLVLDDALVNTDTKRIDRFLNLLEENAGRLQIVLLTCHGRFYRGMKNVSRLVIEEGDGT